MSVIVRILLMVNAAFMLALAASLWGLLMQGREDVLREQLAMRSVVESLIESGQPQSILELLGGSLRHVRLQDGAEAEVIDRVPHWFSALFEHPDDGYRLAFTGSEGASRVLVADDSDEIREVWESATYLTGLFVLAALIANVAIFFGVRSGMKPLADLNQALDQVEQGELQARLGSYALPEAREVAGHFNHMAATLQAVRAENQRLTQRIMRVQEQERGSLARELHDDLGQRLTAMRAQVFLIPLKQQDPVGLKQLAESMAASCEAIQQGFRAIINNLYPVVLEQLGFQAALEEMLARMEHSSGIRCSLECDEVIWPSQDSAVHLYRLLQEGLNNAIRHSDAGQVEVRCSVKDDKLRVTLADNGHGNAALVPGFGIRSMQERARLLGATLTIDSSSGDGTRVYLQLPLDSEHNE